MENLYYAVITLRRDKKDPKKCEVTKVIEYLRAQEMKDLADWLEGKKDRYDASNDGWRPFADQRIGDLLQESMGYFTATDLVEGLDDDLKNIVTIREAPISIYFIDVFALFLEKYSKLAEKTDFALSTEARCCFVLASGLPGGGEDYLRNKYSELWSVVDWAYEKKGHEHRIVNRSADLNNFGNSLAKVTPPEGGPTRGADAGLGTRFGDTNKPLTKMN